jgi:hypothetical protein
MLSLIKHRVNKITELSNLAPGLGAEIDLRSSQGQIILSHDPFQTGDSFADYLKIWAAKKTRGTLILNPKEDQIESQALVLLNECGVTDFFFLDLTIPTTVKLAVREKMGKVAVRVSDYEPVSGALKFKGLAQWIWLDCFAGLPPPPDVISALRGNFKLCLVSPELHGYPSTFLPAFLELAQQADAVCTKVPEAWKGKES